MFPEQANVDFIWDLYAFQLAELFVVKLFNLFFVCSTELFMTHL